MTRDKQAHAILRGQIQRCERIIEVNCRVDVQIRNRKENVFVDTLIRSDINERDRNRKSEKNNDGCNM